MRYRLIELRKSKHLTQVQLADILCTTQSHISRLENNKCEISPFLLADMSEYFNVSPEYIDKDLQIKTSKMLNKTVIKDNSEYDEIILRYKSLNDEHRDTVKLLLDFCYRKEQEYK